MYVCGYMCVCVGVCVGVCVQAKNVSYGYVHIDNCHGNYSEITGRQLAGFRASLSILGTINVQLLEVLPTNHTMAIIAIVRRPTFSCPLYYTANSKDNDNNADHHHHQEATYTATNDSR